MAATHHLPMLNLGFLTIVTEGNACLGGYLVTNLWGRPLEFRLSTAVQPNRVQQILYGHTLQSFLQADLIGKTLADKTGVPAQLILTDREPALDLRLHVETPVIWLAGQQEAAAVERPMVRSPQEGRGAIYCHAAYPGDAATVRDILARLDGSVDLAEPFGRIREAIAEARKMGVTRAA